MRCCAVTQRVLGRIQSYHVRTGRDDVAAYVGALCSRVAPSLVIVNMIYYPHERAGAPPPPPTHTCACGARVGPALARCAQAAHGRTASSDCCNTTHRRCDCRRARARSAGIAALTPLRSQSVIRAVFAHATSAIEVPGVRVVPCALYELLDSRPESTDYEQARARARARRLRGRGRV